MGALEKFLHDAPEPTPFLLKAALAHVQFETIHPFLEGNGRLGRLLIALVLCAEGAVSEPLLYLSLYFKTHREEYYDLLQRVRTDGDWENWVRFFADGVKETAEQAVQTAKRLVKLFEEDREKIQHIGRAAGSALRVHHAFQHKPIATISQMAAMTGLTVPTVTSAINNLETLDVVEPVKERRRGRRFRYVQYIRILSKGTEPP